MAYRVDAWMQQVQTPRCGSSVDRARPDTDFQQLPPPHNPVLKVGQLGDCPVPFVSLLFTPHTGVNCRLAKTLPRPGPTCRPELPAA